MQKYEKLEKIGEGKLNNYEGKVGIRLLLHASIPLLPILDLSR